ncbi:hypothetical protein [Hymenobacter elongatus]|nr:hypothetical protein [Hymenobacter elongatus]
MKNINWPRVLIGLLFLLLLFALVKNLVQGVNRRKNMPPTTQSQ